jgi:YkoY family integral membrane protein
MVLRLPVHQQKQALKYGLFGAYLFRGLCLVAATYLVIIWWLKVVGGLYLIYLAANWWSRKNKNGEIESEENQRKQTRLYKSTVGRLGKFWATVVTVELMDLAFSIDNVFAAVAFSNNILIILCGVFIGILAMRYVAQGFARLIARYPFLEGSAYSVVFILGIKLTLSFIGKFFPESALGKILTSDVADWVTSGLTLGIFLIPLVTSKMFNYPERK